MMKNVKKIVIKMQNTSVFNCDCQSEEEQLCLNSNSIQYVFSTTFYCLFFLIVYINKTSPLAK